MKKTIKYNKLIRDKIPEIIKNSGWDADIRVLGKKEYLEAIKKKFIEESKELVGAKTKKEVINEIIDIQELVDVLISELGIAKSVLSRQQKAKNKKRGGFKKKLFLIKTEK